MTSAVKRSLDVAVAVVGLAISAPLLALAALAVRLGSRGPVLFTHQRVGAGGEPFRLVKLRTMVVANDDSEHASYVRSLIDGTGEPCGELFKLTDDPRCTRVGRVLRMSSLDELPQLLNVLRGEMSLVGPRPATLDEVQAAGDRALGRLAVRPGITGLWQVSGRSRLTYEEMLELDLGYVEAWSNSLDLRILLRTPLAVLRQETA